MSSATQHVGPQGARWAPPGPIPLTPQWRPQIGRETPEEAEPPTSTPTFKTCARLGNPAGTEGRRPPCARADPRPGRARTLRPAGAWTSREGRPRAYFGVTPAAQGSPQGAGLAGPLSAPHAQEGLVTPLLAEDGQAGWVAERQLAPGRDPAGDLGSPPCG